MVSAKLNGFTVTLPYWYCFCFYQQESEIWLAENAGLLKGLTSSEIYCRACVVLFEAKRKFKGKSENGVRKIMINFGVLWNWLGHIYISMLLWYSRTFVSDLNVVIDPLQWNFWWETIPNADKKRSQVRSYSPLKWLFGIMRLS